MFPPAGPENERVHPHRLPAQIDQGPAGIAHVDRGVRLNEVLVRGDVEAAPALGADDARRHRVTEPQRVAHGEHPFADLQRLGIAQRYGRQTVGRDADDRHVGLRIRPDDLGVQGTAVDQLDHDLVGVRDDVVVGEDMSLLGNDEAGAVRPLDLLAARRLLLGQPPAEEVLEEIFLEGIEPRRRGLFPCGGGHPSLRADAHDPRRDPLRHGSEGVAHALEHLDASVLRARLRRRARRILLAPVTPRQRRPGQQQPGAQNGAPQLDPTRLAAMIPHDDPPECRDIPATRGRE